MLNGKNNVAPQEWKICEQEKTIGFCRYVSWSKTQFLSECFTCFATIVHMKNWMVANNSCTLTKFLEKKYLSKNIYIV